MQCFCGKAVTTKGLCQTHYASLWRKENVEASRAASARWKAKQPKKPKRTRLIDHIIPVCGKFVSGLHVHTNMQLLTRQENSAKKNKFDVTRAVSFT